MRSLASMGFRVINPPGPPGQAAWVVYDLDFDTAYEWHQSGCRGADCWCDGLSGVAFLEALHREVLGKARYSLVSAPPGTVAKGSIRLSTGPGIQNKDLTPLEETIRAN